MNARYPALVRRLHWLTVALFAWRYVSRTWSRTVPPDSELAFHLAGLHTLGGVLILTFAVARILSRLRHAPLPPAVSGRMQQRAALTTHVPPHALMPAQPILGFAAVRRAEAALAHAVCAWVAFAPIGFHVGAALWHRLIASLNRPLLAETCLSRQQPRRPVSAPPDPGQRRSAAVVIQQAISTG